MLGAAQPFLQTHCLRLGSAPRPLGLLQTLPALTQLHAQPLHFLGGGGEGRGGRVKERGREGEENGRRDGGRKSGKKGYRGKE